MPKQTAFSFEVPGKPDEVAARLEAQTRWRLTPTQGSLWGKRDKPLGGRVSAGSFRVALDPRDLWTLYQAVAVGTLTETPGGTRIEGVAGLPPWVTWSLRGSFVAAIAAITFAIGGAVTGGDPTVAMIAPALFGTVLGGVTLGIGAHVNNADQQLPALVDAVQRAAAGAPAGDALAERSANAESADLASKRKVDRRVAEGG